MKTLLLSTAIYLLACAPESNQDYLTVKEVTDYKYNNYQKPIKGQVYSVVAKTDNIDTLKLIKEYLNLEGDTRIFFKPIYCNNPKWSMRYKGKEQKFSVQVYALWKIHELVYENYRYLCPFPALNNKENANIETVDGDAVRNAFNLYKNLLSNVTSFKEFKAWAISESLAERVNWYMGE